MGVPGQKVDVYHLCVVLYIAMEDGCLHAFRAEKDPMKVGKAVNIRATPTPFGWL